MRYILSFILLLAVQAVCGVQPYRTEIFNPNVHTLQVRLSGDPLAPPVALLGSDNGIVVSFDMLEDNPQYLYYRVVHCDADWTPSLLSEVEYIDGSTGCRSTTMHSRSTPIATMCIIVSICPTTICASVSRVIMHSWFIPRTTPILCCSRPVFLSPRIWWPFRVR